MPKGLWLSGLYWYQANSSPENQSFVSTYLAKHKVFPDQNVHGAYAGVKVYAAAAAKAGSTAKDSVVKALEGLTVDLPIGKVTIRPEDHQAICDCVWGLTSGYNRKASVTRLHPLKVFPGNLICRPVEETGCTKPRRKLAVMPESLKPKSE